MVSFLYYDGGGALKTPKIWITGLRISAVSQKKKKRTTKKTEDQWSYSSPETICSEQAYGNIFKEWNIWVW